MSILTASLAALGSSVFFASSCALLFSASLPTCTSSSGSMPIFLRKSATLTSKGAAVAAAAAGAAGATPIPSPKILFFFDPASQAFFSALIWPPALSQKFCSLLGAFCQAAASLVASPVKFNLTSNRNEFRTGAAATFKTTLAPFLSTWPVVRPAALRAAFTVVWAACFAALVGAAFFAAFAAFSAAL